jgi:hypothetical protein
MHVNVLLAAQRKCLASQPENFVSEKNVMLAFAAIALFAALLAASALA